MWSASTYARRKAVSAASDAPLAGVHHGDAAVHDRAQHGDAEHDADVAAELASPAATPACSRGMLATATVLTGALSTA